MEKGLQRFCCSCGWQEFIEFDASLSNEEVDKIYKPAERLQKHMWDVHKQGVKLKMEYMDSSKLKIGDEKT